MENGSHCKVPSFSGTVIVQYRHYPVSPLSTNLIVHCPVPPLSITIILRAPLFITVIFFQMLEKG